MGSRRRGFTLIEIMTAMLVMAVITGVATMSITSAKQTAKREAERMQAYIYRQMQKADRIHKNFTLQVDGEYLTVNWGDSANTDTSFKASDGCRFIDENDGDKVYDIDRKGFSGGTIRIEAAGKGNEIEKYYVILAVAKLNEGRVRIDTKKP